MVGGSLMVEMRGGGCVNGTVIVTASMVWKSGEGTLKMIVMAPLMVNGTGQGWEGEVERRKQSALKSKTDVGVGGHRLVLGGYRQPLGWERCGIGLGLILGGRLRLRLGEDIHLLSERRPPPSPSPYALHSLP